MKAISNDHEGFESTYALLMRSEEKQRGRFETFVYTLLVMSCLLAVMQFGRQAMTLPTGLVPSSMIATATAHHGG